MARLPIIDPETAAGEAGRFLDASIQFRGRAPNASRSWANIPYIAKFVLPFHVPIQREGGGGVLSCRIKEMAVLKTSHVNTCDY